MIQLVIGSILISALHALLPNHWLPLLAIGRKESWTVRDVTWIAFLCGLAHAFSTILIGLLLGFLGSRLSASINTFTPFIAPTLLIFLGLFFIWQHHRHHHFHLNKSPDPTLPKLQIVSLLTATMFFSPCLEILGNFFAAGSYGTIAVLSIAAAYLVMSISGMVLWVRWTYQRSMKLNWHALEHNAGIITGVTLMLTGVLSFFIS